jgi:Tfp pilus assembly protein PilF
MRQETLKRILGVSATLLLTISPVTLTAGNADAHPGRTNSSGCHNDNVNGGYHCHNSGSSGSNSSQPSNGGAIDYYEVYMQMGYGATEQQDYQNALFYFNKALNIKPDDYYATQAIQNIYSYYTKYMEIGYAATEDKDYNTALINFRKALEIKPEDTYATQAIQNVESYMTP